MPRVVGQKRCYKTEKDKKLNTLSFQIGSKFKSSWGKGVIMTRTNFDSLIRNAYYGPRHAGSFSSPIKLYQALRKKRGKTPSLYRIRKWMEKNKNNYYNLQNPLSVHTVQQKFVFLVKTNNTMLISRIFLRGWMRMMETDIY